MSILSSLFFFFYKLMKHLQDTYPIKSRIDTWVKEQIRAFEVMEKTFCIKFALIYISVWRQNKYNLSLLKNVFLCIFVERVCASEPVDSSWGSH